MTALTLFFCTLLAPQQPAAAPPGVVVAYSPAKSKQYIGSPGLAVLGNGDYVVSHDFFGPGSTRDVTVVYGSSDRGATWHKRAEIKGQWWSTLFVHRGDLYLMGTSKEYGHCVIRRSQDGGKTWTVPRDNQTGLLLDDGKYHCAPVPVLVHGGKLWRAMEDAQGPGGWGHHFRAFMMSAAEDADLLKASSWTSSNRLARDASWLDGKFGGWLEGNAVLTPEGKVVDLLRVDSKPDGNKGAIIRISDDGKTATFDPKTDFVNLPGGAVKFTIRYDPVSKKYWSLSNVILDKHKGPTPASTRNTLGLICSDDLRRWEVRCLLLYHPDTLKHGWQYVDWLFDGDDLIAASRTAFDDAETGAYRQHDANYLTFHRFRNFRKLTAKDGVVER